MKKLVLVTSIAAASFAVTAANAAPKVYGKAFASVDYVMEDHGGAETTSTQVNSNASRVGVKGSEDLGNGLKALYKAEFEIDVDGDEDVFGQRNIYAGLSHAQLGTILAGKMDDPVKQSQKKVDLFNDLVDGGIDMKKTLAGEVRAANVVAYQTPKMETLPVTLTLAVNLDESDIADNKKDITKDNGFKDEADHGYHASLAYDQDGIYLAVAGAFDAPLKDPTKKLGTGDIIRLVGQAKVADIQLGALYQNAQDDNNDGEQNAWLLSGKYKIAGTNLAVKGQYQQSTTELKGMKDIDIIQFGLGGEYKFSKSTKGHIYFANRNKEQNGAKDKTYQVVGAGLEHKF